jgi:hypothetical protein
MSYDLSNTAASQHTPSHNQCTGQRKAEGLLNMSAILNVLLIK